MALETDEKFKKLLDEGYDFQLYVEERFKAEGFRAHVPEKKFRPDRSKIDEFSDEFDILVFLKNWPAPVRFEVKGSSRYFTSIENFPFDRPFCDRVGTWRRKSKDIEKKPQGIIPGSKQTGFLFFIPVSSEPHWTIKKDVLFKDRSTPEGPYIRDVYEVEKEHCRTWQWLIARLKEVEERRS